MSEERGDVERPFVVQIERLLADSPLVSATWSDNELVSGGYSVTIAGAACVEVGYVGPGLAAEERRLQLAKIVQIIQKHYGDRPVELQGGKWSVVTELRPDYPKIYVQLRRVGSL
ncbi:MAG TPA: hypothetical protein VFK47_18170 [Ktedonobacteraceae bacterium]|nr:hypothetical protein [Ktedonobacteraceae bacterium]